MSETMSVLPDEVTRSPIPHSHAALLDSLSPYPQSTRNQFVL